MNSFVLLVHGWTSNGRSEFRGHLQDVLLEKNINFSSPTLPNSDNPSYKEWKEIILQIIRDNSLDNSSIFIQGHSLGGYTMMRIFCECKNENWIKNVKGVFFVAPVTQKFDKVSEFTSEEIDFSIIKENMKSTNFVTIYSKDDDMLPMVHFENLRKQTSDASNFEIVELNGYKHFEEDKYEIIDEILLKQINAYFFILITHIYFFLCNNINILL